MFPRCHGRRWRAGIALAATQVWLTGFGLAGEIAPPNFFLQTWQTADGLPQNHGTAIVQTRDGYLWLGTYNGLVRFDGARFVVFNSAVTPGLSSSRVTSLHQDRQGVLWLGHDAGELTRLLDGRFEPVPLATNWPSRAVVAIAEDLRHELWLLNESGLLLRVRDGRMLPPAPGTADPSLVRDDTGTLWRVHGGKLWTVGETAGTGRDGPPEDDFVVRACAHRAGGLWLACGDRVRHWQGDGRVKDWGAVPWAKESVTAMLDSRNEQLWVGTLGQGLYVLHRDGGVAHFSRTNGLPHDWVRSLGQDHEGTVWIGTGGGVCAARERRVMMMPPPNDAQGRATLTLHPGADGAMWAGTEGAGVYRWHRGQWTRFSEREGLTNLFAWSVFEDARGQVWAGTWGGGLFQLVDGRFVHPSFLAGETIPICALMGARDGAMWAGTQRGLWRIADGRVSRFGEELARPEVRVIAEARDGTIWFGMSGGGLGRYQAGRMTQFRRADGLPSDYVWSLLTEDDGTLWIGTFGGGLCRWRDGRFAVIGQREGLPNNVISHLVDDRRGHLWMGSFGGILRADKDALHRCADGRSMSVAFFGYGKTDGLTSLECAEGLAPGGCLTADGQLWFPSAKGPAVIDPANIRTNPHAPPVVIEEMRVDGVASAGSRIVGSPGAPRASRPVVRVPPGGQRYEFQYTALSFMAPERVRFKHRLEGAQIEWVDAGAARAVNYSLLPHGDYRFQVIACNNDGVWNEAGATLAFTVLPYVWQTWWFRVAAALVATGAVGGAVRSVTRRRFRRKLELIERQRAIEKERARIAKDIHDDLGASLTRITLLSQTARADLDQPQQAALELDQIYATARELTQAMDEIVWAVNPHHDTLDSLLSYLGGFAQDFLRVAGVRCRLEVPLRLAALPVGADVRHNLFLAFKEAIHNVVRHASASEVRVLFTLEPARFTLAIQDNGRGFDADGRGVYPAPVGSGPAPRLASGNGLLNMRKRLEEVGGLCEVETASGRGTLIRFTVPLRTPM